MFQSISLALLGLVANFLLSASSPKGVETSQLPGGVNLSSPVAQPPSDLDNTDIIYRLKLIANRLDGADSRISSFNTSFATIDNLRALYDTVDRQARATEQSVEAYRKLVFEEMRYAGWLLQFLLGILGIGLALFGVVSWRFQRRIDEALKNVDTAEAGIEIARKQIDDMREITAVAMRETKSLRDDINNNVDAIYARLRLAEVKSVVKGLKAKPSDLFHRFSFLAAQDALAQDHYTDIVTTYITSSPPVDNSYWDYNMHALMLLLQHFPERTILDYSIGDELFDQYSGTGGVMNEEVEMFVVATQSVLSRHAPAEQRLLKRIALTLKAAFADRSTSIEDIRTMLSKHDIESSVIENYIATLSAIEPATGVTISQVFSKT